MPTSTSCRLQGDKLDNSKQSSSPSYASKGDRAPSMEACAQYASTQGKSATVVVPSRRPGRVQSPTSSIQQANIQRSNNTNQLTISSTSLAKVTILASVAFARYVITPVLAAPFANDDLSQDGSQPSFSIARHGKKTPEDEIPETPLMLALDILSIAGLVILGGIFAGLTLGLMGLDMVNLQVLSTSGTDDEQKNAATVLKLLEKGRHWVLVVLLLGNVIVNETLPIFLSDFGGGLTAVLTSTLLIVIFGEIVPQSICARHGLAIGAFCAPLVHAAMILFAPVAWPTAKLLDYLLGEEHGTTYRKAELKTFVSLHQQVGTDSLSEDEVTIIRAVLDLNDKTVKDVMTPIEDVFTLSSDSVLDEPGIAKLVSEGYSRVPIHEPKKPDAILGMLLVKKLITYDPEDGLPVSSFQLTPLPESSPDLTLFDCLNYFQQGRSHMILVSKYPGEARGALGVVTLEDVIEEMIGSEIVDETDVYTDVHNKIKVHRSEKPTTSQEQWQPLIRGIIERRRKLGGPMKTPLRSSFGMASHADAAQGPGAGGAGKYGSMGNVIRAVDQVHVKRTGSPSGSRRGSSATGTTLSRKNTIESESDYYGSPRMQANNGTNGGYVVEVGSHEDRPPRIWAHADLARDRISENPSLEAKAEDAAAEDAEEEGDSENKPLLNRIGKIFGGKSGQ